MIVTLTPNPSLDRTLHLQRLRPGEVNRVLSTLTEPSGKGVNVSLALHQLGHATVAVLPVGGTSGDELVALLDARGLRHDDVAIQGAVRSNISLVDSDGNTTKVNEAGPALDAATGSRLVAIAVGNVQPGDWLAVCGSLPTGFGVGNLVRALAGTRAAGGNIALDTSGEALRHVLAGDVLPDLVKPNAHELAELANRALYTMGDAAAAARAIVDQGVRTVLVSLGGDGAMLFERDGSELWGCANVPKVVNTAGAGDAFLAGYLSATDSSPVTTEHPPTLGRAAGAGQPRPADSSPVQASRLTAALRLGASAVLSSGTLFAEVVDVAIDVREIDAHRRLTEPALP